MAARLSSEELRPAGEGRTRTRARARRFGGARVVLAGEALQPRDPGGILDLAIEGLLARLGPCLGFTLLLWLPFRQVAELFGVSGLDGFAADLSAIAWNSLALVPGGISTSVVVSLVGDALVDRRAPITPGILRGLARAPGVIVLLLITQIVTLPLMVLCIAPYFLAQWLGWAAAPIYVLEGQTLLSAEERARARHSPLANLSASPRRIVRALKRSIALSTGLWSLLRWLLLAILGQLVLGGVLELGAAALIHPEAREFLRGALGLSGATAEFALGAVAALFSSLAACVRAAMMVAFYLDLRVRREGWDLELALERSGSSAFSARAALARGAR